MLSERSYASDTLSLCVWELKIDMLCEEHGWSGGWACGRCRNENSIEWWLREGHSTSLAEECNYRGRKKGFWIDIHYFLSSWDKEHIWVSPNEVDKPRAHHTEWSKSERQKQISYINTHTHMESRKMVLMHLFAGRHRHRQQTWGHRWGRRKWSCLVVSDSLRPHGL